MNSLPTATVCRKSKCPIATVSSGPTRRPDTMAKPCMNACADPAGVKIIVHGGRQEPDAAHDRTARHDATEIELRETPVTDHSLTKPAMLPAIALALAIGAFVPQAPRSAQSAAAEGQKLAFDRSKGNCLTCHDIKGGDLPGTIGPALIDIKSKYPNRDESRRHRHRRNQAQPADRDASVRTQPDFDREGNQRGGGFPADTVMSGDARRFRRISDDYQRQRIFGHAAADPARRRRGRAGRPRQSSVRPGAGARRGQRQISGRRVQGRRAKPTRSRRSTARPPSHPTRSSSMRRKSPRTARWFRSRSARRLPT